MAGKIWIGTSGWNYKDWKNGVFYPHGLKQEVWLRYYSQFFQTVEVNNTFYRLPERQVFERWRQQTPAGFQFTIKASRFFTHLRHLADPAVALGNFFDNALGLGEKLGVVLFQLPPNFPYNPGRLAAFLEFFLNRRDIPGVRAVIEIRDERWYVPDFFDRLSRARVALVLADQPGFAAEGPLTTDFVFVRRHGPAGMYTSKYEEESLRRDAERILNWSGEGKDVYIYFNNDTAGYAIENALRLKEILDKEH